MGDAIDDLEAEIVATEVSRPDCCGNDKWRGHLCQYHQGFDDGTAVALDMIRAMDRPTLLRALGMRPKYVEQDHQAPHAVMWESYEKG